MSTSQPSTQSAVARRSAEAELRRLIAEFAPAHQRLVGAVRRWPRKGLPTAHELAYEYHDFFVISCSPDERGHEGVRAVRASANGVKLYFHRGKELPDPARLSRGSGGQVRWIHVEGASTLARPAVARLIDEAIARNRVPFAHRARTGGHSFGTGQAASAASPGLTAACRGRESAVPITVTSSTMGGWRSAVMPVVGRPERTDGGYDEK